MTAIVNGAKPRLGSAFAIENQVVNGATLMFANLVPMKLARCGTVAYGFRQPDVDLIMITARIDGGGDAFRAQLKFLQPDTAVGLQNSPIVRKSREQVSLGVPIKVDIHF